MDQPTILAYSDDDELWLYRCSADNIFEIISDPAMWLYFASEGRLVIQTPTTIHFHRAEASESSDGDILVQGINGTNSLSVMISPKAHTALDDQHLRTYQGAVAKGSNDDEFGASLEQEFMNLPIHVTFCPNEERVFVHFEIWTRNPRFDERTAIEQKNLYSGLFHLLACTRPGFLQRVIASAKIESFNEFLSENGQFRRPDQGATSSFEWASLVDPSLESVALTAGSCSSNSQQTCENLLAQWRAGTITYQQAHCKLYADPRSLTKPTFGTLPNLR